YKVLDRRGKVLATKRLAAPLPATFVLDKPGKYSVTAYIDIDVPAIRELEREHPGKRSLIVIPAKEQSKQD
ncbi:MAG: hypothetical protein LBP56_07935, partial [Odoribacteraceae bacterium]|nr:hypothetical protein [Odoribacteraceae bacterium]